MNSISREGSRLLLSGFAAGLLLASCPISHVSADDTAPAKTRHGFASGLFAKRSSKNAARGTADSRPQGFQGFGLGYHLGSGYGGKAVGVGDSGGYPYYGGPGYPHPSPCLNRLGAITPFAYFGGPGGPIPGHPNYYGETSPLVADQPVIQFATDPSLPPNYGEYGAFTGTLPYPESTFTPSTATVSAGESGNVALPPQSLASEKSFGLEGEPVPDSGGGGILGLKITSITPGSAAKNSGLRVGDVLLTIDGSPTQRSSDVARLLDAARAGSTLTIKLRRGEGGKTEEIAVPSP